MRLFLFLLAGLLLAACAKPHLSKLLSIVALIVVGLSISSKPSSASDVYFCELQNWVNIYDGEAGYGTADNPKFVLSGNSLKFGDNGYFQGEYQLEQSNFEGAKILQGTFKSDNGFTESFQLAFRTPSVLDFYYTFAAPYQVDAIQANCEKF